MKKDNGQGASPAPGLDADVGLDGLCHLPLKQTSAGGYPSIAVWPHDVIAVEGLSKPDECFVHVSRPNANKKWTIPLPAAVVRMKLWDALTRFASAGFAADLSRKGVADLVKASAAMSVERIERLLPKLIGAGLRPQVELVLEEMTGERIEGGGKKNKASAVAAGAS